MKTKSKKDTRSPGIKARDTRWANEAFEADTKKAQAIVEMVASLEDGDSDIMYALWVDLTHVLMWRGWTGAELVKDVTDHVAIEAKHMANDKAKAKAAPTRDVELGAALNRATLENTRKH